MLKNKNRSAFNKSFILAVVLCISMQLIIVIWNNIYPFGDKTLVYGDGDQYLSMIAYFKSTFSSTNDLFYSWSKVMGGNFRGDYAYYCSSPLNLLILPFNNLVIGIHFIVSVKLILSAISFAVLLNKFGGVDNHNEIAISAFSAAYPFMGYVVSYIWNYAWLDGVMLLPIIVAGIIEIVKNGKFFIYTISLAIALISNFYVGFMLCIASVIFFIAVLVLKYTNLRSCIKASGIYFLSSLIAGGLASIVLLPAYFSIPNERSVDWNYFINNMGYTGKPLDVISMLFSYPMHNMDYGNNYPIVFSGPVQFLFAVYFFFNKKVNIKKKMVAGVVLFVFFLSFGFDTINLIWHGGSWTAGFNYRYSFIFSFIIMIMAFDSYVNMDRGDVSKLYISGAVIAALVFVMLEGQRSNVLAGALFGDIICFVFAIAVQNLQCVSNKGVKNAGTVVFTLLICIGMLRNAHHILKTDISSSSMESYLTSQKHYQAFQNAVDDDSFYRIGRTMDFGRCDAALFGYRGIQNYSSMEETNKLDILKKLGIEHVWMWGEYNNNVPLGVDSLFGIKYLDSTKSYKDSYYTMIYENEGRSICRNEYSLPLMFFAKKKCNIGTESNTFKMLNQYWNSISLLKGEVYIPVDFDVVWNESAASYDVTYQSIDGNPVYAYFPDGATAIEGVGDGVSVGYSIYQNIAYVGSYAAGECVSIRINAGADYLKDNIYIYSEDEEAIKRKVESARQNLIEIEEKKSSELYAMVNIKDDNGIIATSIPYDEEWKVYVDHERVDIFSNMDLFLAFSCDGGEHQIHLSYVPKGIIGGRIISLISLFFLMILMIHNDETRWVYNFIGRIFTKITEKNFLKGIR